ncbi:MAG: MBL fold metallo-hydrolase [Candidatus Saliniplasma sp.]
MLSITVHGGAGEIGGNKILVENEDTRIMLDFGTRMGFESDYFAEFVKPRSNTGLRDRLILGSLPFIPGIYREDMIRPIGLDDVDDDGRVLNRDSRLLDLSDLITYEDHTEEHGEEFLDALFLSHAHFDHVGDMNYIHPDIPLYCSDVTKTLVETIDELTKFKSEAISMKRPEIDFRKSGMFADEPYIKKEDSERDCFTLGDGEWTSVGSIEVKAIDVDHSVPGASSYIVETEGKKVLYTGDIRFHGTYPLSIDEYAAKVGDDVDVMICEGTRVDSESLITEEDVKQQIIDEIKEVEGLVFVDFSWKDTTRYETIRDACKECGRTFIIDARLAYLLNELGEKPETDDMKVFLKRRGSALYSPTDYSRAKHEYGYSVDKENLDPSHYENGLTALEIMEEPGNYVLMFSYYDLNQLFDFADENGKIPDSKFIRAQCEPFSDDMALDEERMINWLERFGIDFEEGEPDRPPGCNNIDCEKIKPAIDRSHVSGHASRPELNELIGKIDPDTLIPVHTLNPGEFKNIVPEGVDVVVPERGETYEF